MNMEGLERNNNNYFNFLNSIIHKTEFKDLDESDSEEEYKQYIYFNKASEYQYENDIEELIIDEVIVKKDEPKTNFYKYFFSSIFIVSSAATVSYLFSKKRNNNKK